jgi:hypothetical protein
MQPLFRRWAKGALSPKQIHKVCALLLEVLRYGREARWTCASTEEATVLVAFVLSADFRAIARGAGRDVVLRLDAALAACDAMHLRHDLWRGVLENVNIYDSAADADFLVDAVESSPVAAWHLAARLLSWKPTDRRGARERLRLGIHLLGHREFLPAETCQALFDAVVSELPSWVVEAVTAGAALSAAEKARRSLQLELARERAAVHALAAALRDAEVGRGEALARLEELAHFARVSGDAAGQLATHNGNPVWTLARFSV